MKECNEKHQTLQFKSLNLQCPSHTTQYLLKPTKYNCICKRLNEREGREVCIIVWINSHSNWKIKCAQFEKPF
jgi:hypothetical protein